MTISVLYSFTKQYIKTTLGHWRLTLYDVALWGRDLVSMVCIREGPFYRGFFFHKKVGENFFSRHRKLSVIGEV